ncbi:MAG: GNAT family N-acetyltransferase [Clostridia bacterium]|nr:GNAT family N-acetyltransferase [Clostridia bacterium]
MKETLKQISFKKMNSDEFKVYSKWSVKAYADHLLKADDERFRFKALKAAKSEFRDVFPEGADSADNYLYIVVNKNNEKIGVIGYQKSPFEENAAFVTENVIKEKYRGKGYGKKAFVKLQEDACEKGFSKMVLNVFKHTSVSYAMYEKNGFKVIEDYGGSVIMEKHFNNENSQF